MKNTQISSNSWLKFPYQFDNIAYHLSHLSLPSHVSKQYQCTLNMVTSEVGTWISIFLPANSGFFEKQKLMLTSTVSPNEFVYLRTRGNVLPTMFHSF